MAHRRNLPQTPFGMSGNSYGYGPLSNEDRGYAAQSTNSNGSRVHTAQPTPGSSSNVPPVRVVRHAHLSSASSGEYIHPSNVYSVDNLFGEDLTDQRPLLGRESPPLYYQTLFPSRINEELPQERPSNLPGMYNGTQYTEGQDDPLAMYDESQYSQATDPRDIAASRRGVTEDADMRDIVGLADMLAAGPPGHNFNQPRIVSQGSTQYPEVPQLVPALRPSTISAPGSVDSAIELLAKITELADRVIITAQEVMVETDTKHFLHKFVPGVPKLKTLLELLETLCDAVGKACLAVENTEVAFLGNTPDGIKSAYDAAIDTCIRMSLHVGNIAIKQKQKHRIQAARKGVVTLVDLLGTKLRVLVMSMASFVPRPRENNPSFNKEDDHFLGKRMRRVHEEWVSVPLPLSHKLKKKHDLSHSV